MSDEKSANRPFSSAEVEVFDAEVVGVTADGDGPHDRKKRKNWEEPTSALPAAVHSEHGSKGFSFGSSGELSAGVRQEQRYFVNPAVAYLQSLTSNTSRVTMASKLNVVARMTNAEDLTKCDWSTLTADAVLSVMTTLEVNGHSSSTVNCYLSALKGVAKAAWLAGQMSHEIFLRINAVKQRRFHRLPTGRSLSYAETGELVSSCDPNTPGGARDRAILLLMVGCGLRRGEVPNLQLDALDLASGSLTLVGKGDKERRVFLPEAVVRALTKWIRDFRGFESGYLFGRIYKNGRISLTRPMTARAVGNILDRHMKGVDSPTDYSGKKVKTTSHDLRRTFATRLLDDNVDIVTVKKMMGHASVTTTAQYDRRGENAQKEAARRVRI